MALSTQDPVLAKRRFMHAATLDAGTREMARTLFSFLMQQGSPVRPNLQVVEFGPLVGTDAVIADAPCTLYALILHKTTATASYSKATDHATTCATDGTQDISIKLADTNYHFLAFPRGRAFAAGITMQGNTTGTGSTSSSTNGASGVALIGA